MSRNSGLVVPLILLNSQGGGGGGGTTSLADGGTGSSLSDPGADRIMFWDESGNVVDWLSVGSGLSISGTTLSATGLTQFTAAESTSSPNNTVYVDSLTAAAASTNADFAAIPKGTGAFLLAIPDSAATGGNKRGANAFDGSTKRTAATQVASGTASVVLGENVTASATRSVAIGYATTASASNAVAIGGATSSAAYGIAIGNGAVASGPSSGISVSNSGTASATASMSFSYLGVASGEFSTAMGYQSTTRGLTGVRAYGGKARSVAGDAQLMDAVQRVTTTDATVTSLTDAGVAASSVSILVMPNNSAAHVRTRVVAMTASAGIVGSWLVEGTFKRVANAASTALVGATTVTAFGQDAGFATCVVDLVADTTNGGPVVRVTGVAATTIYWVAHTDLVQVA